MKHLSYNEFTELMKNKGNVSVTTENGVFSFSGISKHTVCVEFYVELKSEYQIGENGYYVILNNVIPLTEAQCMYMSLK